MRHLRSQSQLRYPRPRRGPSSTTRVFFFSSRRRHTRCGRDWSSDVCSSDLTQTSVNFDRYVEIDGGLGSTFFVIPFKDYPGRTVEGEAPGIRAARYAASDIAAQIRKLVAVECEVGLHGIDAWLDSSKGRQELEQVSRISGLPDTGVRMHW